MDICGKGIVFNVYGSGGVCEPSDGCQCSCGCKCDCGCGEGQKPEENPETGCNCKVKSILEITVGDGGEFKTLREALNYMKTVIYNSVRINLVSDVTEDKNGILRMDSFLDGFSTSSVSINGNEHILNLDIIKATHGLLFDRHTAGQLKNITIKASNAILGVVGVGNNSFLDLMGNVKIIGGGSDKTAQGIYVYHGSSLTVTATGNSISNCTTGMKAVASSNANVFYEFAFTGVTNQFLPAKETVGNKHSYIATMY